MRTLFRQRDWIRPTFVHRLSSMRVGASRPAKRLLPFWRADRRLHAAGQELRLRQVRHQRGCRGVQEDSPQGEHRRMLPQGTHYSFRCRVGFVCLIVHSHVWGQCRLHGVSVLCHFCTAEDDRIGKGQLCEEEKRKR